MTLLGYIQTPGLKWDAIKHYWPEYETHPYIPYITRKDYPQMPIRNCKYFVIKII